MGRREIWSDPSIQKLASEFVCVIEETFFLFPPDWMKNPPNPESTRLFKTYAANAPANTWPAGTSTHQGLYCMTPDGGYLSGKFANPSNEKARDILSSGLKNWRKNAANPKPVPTNRLDLYGGEPLQKGGIKLEVVYRDFPRGDVERPGTASTPNPYNLGWYDFSPTDAQQFLTEPGSKKKLPEALFLKLARTTLKDAVRGQMTEWKPNEMKEGELISEFVSENGPVKTYRLTGFTKFSTGDRSYEPTLHGIVKFDTASSEFTEFKLIAAGQRIGRAGANGRETDLGPAPLGVAFQLYQ